MKIDFNLSDLISALDLVSIVNPNPVTGPNNAAGYLFVVKGNECSLYARGEETVSKAKFNLISSDGDGSFVFPSENLGASLRPLLKEEETCVIEATSEEGKYIVSYKTSPDGSEAEFGSFDPALVSMVDDDLEAAAIFHEFSSGVLREALSLSKPYIADVKSGKAENLMGVEVLDKDRIPKGDGYLYAAEEKSAYYFWSDHFNGKSLEIHGKHLGSLLNFLSKSSGTVTIRKGKNNTFAVNDQGCVFGWSKHNKLHDKFNFYTLKRDALVVQVVKTRMLNALYSTKGTMKKDKVKVKFNFDSDKQKISFEVPEAKGKSIKVDVVFKKDDDAGVEPVEIPKSFSIGANIDQLISLIESMKGHNIELRTLIQTENDKATLCLFRTIDDFRLELATGKVTPELEGSVACRVTRFMPSMN